MNLKEQNILFFTRTMKLGGTENVVLQLCEIFKPLVNSIVVCSCGGVNVDKLNEMDIKHYLIPDIENKSISTLLTVCNTVKTIVKKERISIIHTHHRMAAFYVSLLGLYRKCKFINTSHNTFDKFYMEECDKHEDYEYHMLMFVHNLEKGMCMPNPRPFGQEKVERLMHMIEACEKRNRYVGSSAYKMSISILNQWLIFYKKHKWDDELCKKVESFIERYSDDLKSQSVGYEIISKHDLILDKNASFDEVLRTRKAVRSFSADRLDEDVVRQCIFLAQTAPTACNRQMVEILHVEDRKLCNLITKTIYGASGFSKDTVNYFVITFDMKSLDYYGERNQGYLNAGLVAMNFVNALHSRGIGSCFIQWANTEAETKVVCQALKISENKRIAVVIGAGYYIEEEVVAKSCRRDIDEIFRRI